ncbi:molybdenum ABC transporter ATP-binding protein [Pseudomonadota bacterium]
MPIKAKFELAYEGFQLDVDLDLPANGVTTLFGPSGSGKSTLLRCIAGLEEGTRGHISIGDEVWSDTDKSVLVPTQQRSLGYVFQEPRLFSHLTVQKNLEYGYKRTPVSERRIEWKQVIDMLDIGHLLQRKPHRLSGGEQQRISIGRALLASPKVLLMDEPLASLDMARKQEVLPFIRTLHDALDIPVIYVSHSLQEVLQITDTLVLMREGTSIAAGPMTVLCSELEFSQYLGDMSGSVIDAHIASHDEAFGLTHLTFPGGELLVPQQPFPIGQHQRVHILARNVGIALEEPQVTTSFLNILKATVVDVAVPNSRSHSVQVKLDVGVPLLTSISLKSLHALKLEPGRSCYALIKAVSLTENMHWGE